MTIKTKLTPVRYPGGKSNGLKKLDPFLLKTFREYREPFFGGGSVGLYLMQFNPDAQYWINDIEYPVYCFWKTLYERPQDMVDFLLDEKLRFTMPGTVVKGTPSASAKKGRDLWASCRQEIRGLIERKDNEFLTGCQWYILNKTSYSGMWGIGNYTPLAWDQNFTENCIRNLPKTSALMHSVRSIQITCLDYTSLLHGKRDSTGVYIFLDPPYDIKDNLYGLDGNTHQSFDHMRFYQSISKCKQEWLITYNDDPVLVDRFKGYHQHAWELQYTMKAAKREGQAGSKKTGKSGKKGEELLIWNYDIRETTEQAD